MLFQAHRGSFCGLLLSCAREFQNVTALACLNKDTSIMDDSNAPDLTDIGCTVLQSIQKQTGCLLSAWREVETFHITSFSTAFSTQNIAVGNQILNCTSTTLIAVNLYRFFSFFFFDSVCQLLAVVRSCDLQSVPKILNNHYVKICDTTVWVVGHGASFIILHFCPEWYF